MAPEQDTCMATQTAYYNIMQMVTKVMFASAELAGRMSGVAGFSEAQAEAESQKVISPDSEVKALHDVDESAHEDESHGVEAVLKIGLLSSGEGLPAFVSEFAKAALNRNASVAWVNGTQRMTQAIWDALHPDDALDMALRWASFFATPDMMQESESGKPQESPTPPKAL